MFNNTHQLEAMKLPCVPETRVLKINTKDILRIPSINKTTHNFFE